MALLVVGAVHRRELGNLNDSLAINFQESDTMDVPMTCALLCD